MGVWVLAAAIVLAGTIGAGIVFLRLRGQATDQQVETQRISEMRADNIEQSVANMMTAQSELAGRLSQLAEAQTRSQAGMMKSLEERLDAVKLYMGRSMTEQTDRTSQTLHQLHTRLSMIDEAQRNISQLSDDVISLKGVLGGGQARGLFGEMQMRDLVTTSLPPSAYSFQKVLANGRTADCLIELPNPPGPMVIDARFPLESYYALRDAQSDADKAQAERGFRNAVLKHVVDIAERFIVAGDTAESALMFLPSEAVYAELHANFPDVVEKSFRARVWIVSPTTLMATLNTVRAVLKDARLREQAQIIHKETGLMLDDVSRLQKRVLNLQAHFGQAEKDVREVLIAADKIARRAERIEEVQIGSADTQSYVAQQPAPRQIEAQATPAAAAAPVKPAAPVTTPRAFAPAPVSTPAPAAPAAAPAKTTSTESRDPASVWANLWLSAMTGKKDTAAPTPGAKPLSKAQGVMNPAATAARVPNAFLPDPVKRDAVPTGKETATKPAVPPHHPTTTTAPKAPVAPASKPTPVVPTAAAMSFADIAEDLAEFGVPLAPLAMDPTSKPASPAPAAPIKKIEPTHPATQPSTLAKAAAPKPVTPAASATTPPASKLYPAGLNPFVTPASPRMPTPAKKLPTDSKIELPKAAAKKDDASKQPFLGSGHAIYFPAMSLAPKGPEKRAETPAAPRPTATNPLEPKPYVKNPGPAKPAGDLAAKKPEAEKRAAGDSAIPDDEPDFDIDFDDRPTIWPLV